MLYLALGVKSDGSLVSLETDGGYLQDVANEFLAKCGFTPVYISLVGNGDVQSESGYAPKIVDSGKLGEQYFGTVADLDTVIVVIKSWVDHLDDADDIARAFTAITGAKAKVIQSGNGPAKIAYNPTE